MVQNYRYQTSQHLEVVAQNRSRTGPIYIDDVAAIKELVLGTVGESDYFSSQ
jgi:hypothetical protein